MEKKYMFGIYFTAVLTAFGLLGTIMVLVQNVPIFPAAANLVVYLLVLYYASDGYKKPHGNMLKWLMITFAVSLLFSLNSAIKDAATTNGVIIPLTMMLITYMAGRLHKIEKNKYIAVVILLLLCHIDVSTIVKLGITSPLNIVSILSGIILWTDLCAAYFLRYAEHKEAGLADKSKSL